MEKLSDNLTDSKIPEVSACEDSREILIIQLTEFLLKPTGIYVSRLELIWDNLLATLPEKLIELGVEKIVQPRARVLVPILEQLKVSFTEPIVKECIYNLLAALLDPQTSSRISPSFLQTLAQLSEEELRLLKFFRMKEDYMAYDVESMEGGVFRLVTRNISPCFSEISCNPEVGAFFLDNLERIGLIRLESSENENAAVPRFLQKEAKIDPDAPTRVVEKKIKLTDYGREFCTRCSI